MHNRIALMVFVIMFAAQMSFPAASTPADTFPLLPQQKTAFTESNFSFRELYDTVCLALFIYKFDADGKYSTESLIEKYGPVLFSSEVRFDLAQIEIGRKLLTRTRYYPFSIRGKEFIVRIFLTEKKGLQDCVPVLFEAPLTNPAVTIQILPPLSSIIKDCRTQPHRIRPYTELATAI